MVTIYIDSIIVWALLILLKMKEKNLPIFLYFCEKREFMRVRTITLDIFKSLT